MNAISRIIAGAIRDRLLRNRPGRAASDDRTRAGGAQPA
jgi:hypothetical protein